MKKVFALIFCISLFVSCKNDTKTNSVEEEQAASKSYDQNDGLITLKGDFIYDESQNAAVIQTANSIYGVVIDDNMKALNEKVKAYKKESTDMVPVTVRAKRFAKPEGEEGWPFRLEIKETIKVEAPNPEQNDVIKIEN
ncbi:hypothetical protein DFQ05_1747 [Winogradskyella wandonensis]|uniref:NlpE-like protein n=1 Tax=Winogradskyella wandonensis TaxID=1442586 RepID=A0A4R1KTW0_9FLAO|nr:hypothetical protein [Winogradskyella wandonensis]TCK67963.1 hypothetical protein DFQ05_1747 [Winogradskyella wandonensis]